MTVKNKRRHLTVFKLLRLFVNAQKRLYKYFIYFIVSIQKIAANVITVGKLEVFARFESHNMQ
jgi:hypothetical protein